MDHDLNTNSLIASEVVRISKQNNQIAEYNDWTIYWNTEFIDEDSSLLMQLS